MTREINRIPRCGGLNKLNPEQKRYVHKSLKVMDENGGEIRAHRCFTNSTLLSLMDFIYRDGRITACDGTVDNYPHSWCEIDKIPFEITYPLLDISEREARQFTLSSLRHSYKVRFRYEWTVKNFGRVVFELFQMTHPLNGNLSPENGAILLELVGRKLGVSLRQDEITRFAGSASKVCLESDRIFKRGRRTNETVAEFQKRWGKEVDRLQRTLIRTWSREFCMD